MTRLLYMTWVTSCPRTTSGERRCPKLRHSSHAAVKSNPDPVVLRLMLGLGRGFDCSSKKEIQTVLDIGASPDRIIFAHPFKQASHLRFAREKGVSLMTFDTEEELYKVKRVYPEAKLVLRLRFDAWKMPIKFGCRDSKVRPLLGLAKELGLSVCGASFYIGNIHSVDPKVFVQAIRHTRSIFEAGRGLGLDMDLLDIGGGFPGRLHTKKPFEKYADAVREALEENFPPSMGVKVIAEPGTFYTQSAGHLVTNVIAKRLYRPGKDETTNGTNGTTNGTNGHPVCMYYLNVGVFNAFSGRDVDSITTLFEVPELLRLEGPVGKKHLKPSCLWGPTCYSKDVIFDRCMMAEMESGDFVIFHDMGAYITSSGCGFNGFEVPPTCYIAPKDIRPLLKRIFSA